MNPYEVLGVSPDADEETIKKAYRTLVKKYHPDRYVNTPMADVASEKMKQINEAYDMITNKKTSGQNPFGNGYSGGYGGYGYGGGFGGYGYGGYDTYSQTQTNFTPSFENVRKLITMRRFQEAEQMLSKLSRTAEWYYLMGVVYINKGWYSQGMEYINEAVRLDPENTEYRATQNSFQNNNRNYRNVVFTNSHIPCDICSSLCATFLCYRFFCGCC